MRKRLLIGSMGAIWMLLLSGVLWSQTRIDLKEQKPSAAKRVQAKTAPTPVQAATQAEESTTPATEQQLPALPTGTAVKMKLETALSTSTNKAGDQFAGRVTEDVAFQGKTVIPVGSSIHGRVVHVSEQRRYKGLPTLEIHPEGVTLPNGEKYVLNAVIADTSHESKTSVDDEGRIRGQGMNGRDKLEISAGTGAGAGMGALIARSGTGTLVGAAIGGGAAMVYWLSKHKSASLAPGTEIIMELSRPMTIAAASD
jgi:hypothetical protein